MFPVDFDYQAAKTVPEAIRLLGDEPDAKLLAGGQSLIPLMKLRLATPATLIDIGRVGGLSYITDHRDHIAIGAMTLHRHLVESQLLRERLPIVPAAAARVGDPQVRQRGTLGGSIAHADPAADLAAVVLALDGLIVVTSLRGEREVPVREFFQGYFETVLAPDEILVEIRLPASIQAWAFQKFVRRAQDWATVAVAAVRTDTTRLALANMGATPLRAAGVERALAEGLPLEDAARLADHNTTPPDDVTASPAYRRHLAKVLTRRALRQLDTPIGCGRGH